MRQSEIKHRAKSQFRFYPDAAAMEFNDLFPHQSSSSRFCFGRYRQREIKSGSVTRFTLDPDPAAMDLNYSLHQSKTNPGTTAFHIQFIEQTEDSIVMFR